jgi:putative sigma-54 modulation protein
MRINFTSRHTEVTPEIRKYCERRLESIEKLVGYPLEANLILAVEKYRHIAEINIKTKMAMFNTQKETQDMFSSIGVAFDHIEKRVKKEREKLRERKRRSKEFEITTEPVEEEEGPRRIIRDRNYPRKPMSVEEAVLQLEGGSNDVFVFRKFDTEKWAVLYRRKDGNYGLIEPD